MSRIYILTFILLLFFPASILAETTIVAEISISCKKSLPAFTPVSINLEELGLVNQNEFVLFEINGSKRQQIPCQVERGDSVRLWWIMSGKTAPGQARKFELRKGGAQKGNGIRVTLADRHLEISQHNRRVLRYHLKPLPAPDGRSVMYSRDGFIHPLWSPSGRVLTWIHPADHIHHLGLWHPWTRVKVAGRTIDFWNLNKGEGTIRFARLRSTADGPVFGGFTAVQDHLDLKAKPVAQPVIKEHFRIRVWNRGKPGLGTLIDYTMSQQNVSGSELVIDQYRYGGFGLRATEEWSDGRGSYLTSEGKSIKDADGSRARWCILSGPSGDGETGILFMGHPQNRDFPEAIRIWNEGFDHLFFNFCPVKLKAWTIRAGQTATLRYRIFIFDGPIPARFAEQMWRDYATPPDIKIKARIIR